MSSAPDHARLFFALFPPREVRRELVERQRASALPARPVAADKLHITLAFLGNVALGRIGELRALGDGLVLPQCELILDRLGCFRRARVAWLGSSGDCAPLEAFQAELQGQLGEAGFRVDQRRWRPHVTLYRDLRRPCASLAVEPVCWTVRRFDLIQSRTEETGPVYRSRVAWKTAG